MYGIDKEIVQLYRKAGREAELRREIEEAIGEVRDSFAAALGRFRAGVLARHVVPDLIGAAMHARLICTPDEQEHYRKRLIALLDHIPDRYVESASASAKLLRRIETILPLTAN